MGGLHQGSGVRFFHEVTSSCLWFILFDRGMTQNVKIKTGTRSPSVLSPAPISQSHKKKWFLAVFYTQSDSRWLSRHEKTMTGSVGVCFCSRSKGKKKSFIVKGKYADIFVSEAQTFNWVYKFHKWIHVSNFELLHGLMFRMYVICWSCGFLWG